MRTKKEHWITYEDLIKQDLVQKFSDNLCIDRRFVEELIRLCDTDFRFRDGGNKAEYKKISEYVYMFWNVDIPNRKIKYIYGATKNYNRLEHILRRGGRMKGTFRNLVLRKS